MLLAALRDLQWRRRRFLIVVLGTALVFAMTLVLAGLSAAFGNEVDRTVTTTGADEWAIVVGATGPFNSSAVLPAGTWPGPGASRAFRRPSRSSPSGPPSRGTRRST